MLQPLVLTIAIFLFAGIFISRKNYTSLQWVIVSMILLNASIVVIYSPLYMSIWRWLILSLFFAAIYQIRRCNNEFAAFPLRRALKFVMFCVFLIAITDSRLSVFYKFYYPFIEITEKYILLFFGYFAIRDRGDINKMARPLLIGLILITVYGIYNYLAGVNPYFKWVIETFVAGTEEGQAHASYKLTILDNTAERFRAVSTFSHTFNYGYASSLLAVFFFALFNIGKGKGTIVKLAFLLGLIGVVLCFSRIVLIATFIAFIVLIIFSTSLYRKMIIITTVFLLGIIVYTTVPTFQLAMNNTMDIFVTGGESAKGSNIDMRIIQLAGSFGYFLQSPFVGNGFGYINKELGWATQDNALLDPAMEGFESIIYHLMIEQGALGLLSHFVLLLALIHFFYRNLEENRVLSSLGLAIVALFFAFAVGTGPLGSWPLTMLFLGMIIKTITLANIERAKDAGTIKVDHQTKEDLSNMNFLTSGRK
jgi:hypothetical protein